jgi:anti-anti-sigma regulatory factor
MSEDLIAKSGNMEIRQLPNSLILVIRIHGFIKSGDFKKDQQMLHDTIKKRRINRLLINQQELKVMSQEVLEFLMHSVDDFAKNGIRKMATVSPKDPFAQAGIAKIKSSAKDATIEIREFPSEVAALEWLGL